MSEVNDKILSLVMESLDEKKMDAVGQEDGDVDNDGDEDESDAYILKRRKAIKKAMTKEEVEEVDHTNEIIELTAEIMIEENIDYDSLSEEEINELLGAVARGIGKAAGAAGRGIASRVTMAGRADRAAKKADKMAAKADNQDKLRAARQKIVAAKKRMAATKAGMRQDRQPNAMSRA